MIDRGKYYGPILSGLWRRLASLRVLKAQKRGAFNEEIKTVKQMIRDAEEIIEPRRKRKAMSEQISPLTNIPVQVSLPRSEDQMVVLKNGAANLSENRIFARFRQMDAAKRRKTMLALLRRKTGKTRDEIAGDMGVHHSTLDKWAAGYAVPSWTSLRDFWRRYGSNRRQADLFSDGRLIATREHKEKRGK